MTENNDEDVERSLADWGQHVIMPPTPDIATRVTAILKQSPAQRPRFQVLTGRRPMLFSAIAAGLILAVVLGTTLSHMGNSHSVAQPPVPLASGAFLTQAAVAYPAANHVTRLTYRVQVTTAKGSTIRRVNIWERYTPGQFTAVEIDRALGFRIGNRFVEERGHVWRTNSTPADMRLEEMWRQLAGPSTTETGQLVAREVLRLTKLGNDTADFGGRQVVKGRTVYIFHVSPPYAIFGTYTLMFDAHNYQLISIRSKGYTADLVSTHVYHQQNAPSFALVDLNGNSIAMPPAGQAPYTGDYG